MAQELVSQHRRLTMLEAEWLKGLAAFDRRLGWQVMGYRSCAAWLAKSTGVTMMTAREKLRVARVLADGLPVVGAALAEGRITYAAARALTRLPEAEPSLETALVTAAEAGATVGELEDLVRRAREAIDPEKADKEAMRAFDRRGLHLTRGMSASVLGDFELEAEDGELLVRAIESVLATERAAGNPVVHSPVDSAETRTPAQRRADALMVLVRAGLEHLEAAQPGRSRTEVLVLFDPATSAAQTHRGTARTAEQARRAACDGALRRVVLGAGGEVIDVGRRTRVFSPAQRAATFARDRGCRFPHCGRSFGLELHHVVPVEEGGVTATANAAWKCRYHHRLVHEGGWRVTGSADGTLLYHPPDGGEPLASEPPGRLRLPTEDAA